MLDICMCAYDSIFFLEFRIQHMTVSSFFTQLFFSVEGVDAFVDILFIFLSIYVFTFIAFLFYTF